MLDYDGTICDHKDRFNGIAPEVAKPPIDLLEGGFALGIATGTLLVLRGLKERFRKRLCLGAPPQLFRWPPIGASLVQRVENDVAATGIIETLNELAGWVVDNGCIAAPLYLPEDLKHDRGFTGPRVSNDLHVLRFCPGRNANHGIQVICFYPDTVALDDAIELFGREQNRATETAAILHHFAPLDVLADGERKLQSERQQPERERQLEDVEQFFSTEHVLL